MKHVSIFIPVIGAILLWEIISDTHLVNPSLFPPPSDVARVLGASTTRVTLLSDLKASMWRMLVGLCLGCASGISAGLLTGRIRAFEKAFAPIIHARAGQLL